MHLHLLQYNHLLVVDSRVEGKYFRLIENSVLALPAIILAIIRHHVRQISRGHSPNGDAADAITQKRDVFRRCSGADKSSFPKLNWAISLPSSPSAYLSGRRSSPPAVDQKGPLFSLLSRGPTLAL